MVRHYKRKPGSRTYRDYDDDAIDKALIEIIEGRLSLQKASKQFKIPYGTLYNKFTGRHIKPVGSPTVLSVQEEDRIVKCVKICGDWGYPLDREDLKSFVQAFLQSKGVNVPKFENNYPGADWVDSFLQRHNGLRIRRAGNITRSRAEVSVPVLEKYFDELKKSVDGVPPSHIYNFDETAFTDDPGSKKLLFRRGTKHAANIQNHSKSSTTVVMCGSADGVLLPPYVVYKAEYVYPTWVEVRKSCKKYCQKDCCGSGMRYNASKSGWINPMIFEDWFFRHFLPHARKQPGKKVLLCDNLSSHFTERVILACSEHNVAFVPLLPNSTHLLQPLDVAFFRPMKVAWRKVLRTFKIENKKTKVVPKSEFPDLLHSALEAMDTIQPRVNGPVLKERIKNNLASAFAKAGIFPFNPEKVLIEIPGYSKAPGSTNKNNKPPCYCHVAGSPEESALVALLKEQRFDVRTTRKPKAPRGKKFDVVPGRSVSMADINAVRNDENEENVDDVEPVGSTQEAQNETTTGRKILKKPRKKPATLKAQTRKAPSTTAQMDKALLKRKTKEKKSNRNVKKLKKNTNASTVLDYCVVCNEDYSRPGEEWIQCCSPGCRRWTHLDCSGADTSTKYYVCILCII